MRAREFRQPFLRNARRPVAFFANGIGDSFLSLPAVRALAELFPHRLVLICGEGRGRIFYRGLPLGRVVETPMWFEDGVRQFDAAAVARTVGGCDLFLSLVPWRSRSLEELMDRLSPRFSVGFSSGFAAQLPLDFGKHSSELSFDVPRFLDPSLAAEHYAAPPALPARALRRARSILRLIPRTSCVLVVHGDTARKKMWKRERFVLVLDRFLSHHPEVMTLVVGLGPPGLDQGAQGHRIVPTFSLRFEEQFALVAHADLFLGVNSCMLHAADFWRVPGVGLFGPFDAHEFGFRFAPHRHVRGDGTMRSIKSHKVLEALEAVYAQNDRRGLPPRRFRRTGIPGRGLAAR